MKWPWSGPRSGTEIILGAVLLVLVVTFAASQGYERVLLPTKRAFAEETRHLEARLTRLRHLQENEQEIRGQYRRLVSARAERGQAEDAPREDPLQELERIASDSVRISKVYPLAAEGLAGDQAARTEALAIEFWDEDGNLDEFLLALATELSGDVTAFRAEMDGETGTLRCQATIHFAKGEESD